MVMTGNWQDLRSDFEAGARRLATLAGDLDANQSVGGSDWTVGETIAHVTTALDRWTSMARGTAIDVGRGKDFAPRMAEINRDEINALGRCSPDEEVAGADRWLDVASDAEASMHMYGIRDTQCTLAEATGILLGEILIHGYDVARAAGAPWPISTREAIAVSEGVLPLLPLLYDGSATDGRTFDIDMRLRGRDRGIDFHCDPEALTISDGSPDHATVHISADPTAWLLVGYGRRSQWWAAVTGKVVAWGRRPFLALRFGHLVPPP